MEDHRIIQVVEANKQALARIIDVSVAPDGSTVTFGKGRIRRAILVTSSYIIIIISLLFFVFSFQIDWRFAPIWPALILWCIYIIRMETRSVIVDLDSRTVNIGGKWQKGHTFDWTCYQGYEISCSVKDIPEEFYVKFHDRDHIRKIKLANMAPLFKRYVSVYNDSLLAVWNGVYDEISLHQSRIGEVKTIIEVSHSSVP